MTDTVLKLWSQYCWRTVVELVRPQIEELEHDLDALDFHTERNGASAPAYLRDEGRRVCRRPGGVPASVWSDPLLHQRERHWMEETQATARFPNLVNLARGDGGA